MNKISPGNPFVDKEDKDQKRIVWTTKMVDYALEAMDQGYKIKNSPFHENKLHLRKANIVFQYTEYELNEIRKCANDVVYFAENYAHVMTDEGVRKIGKGGLRDYQEGILNDFFNNRLNILCSARQSGKTITSCIFIAHYLLFNFDKNALLLANKEVTTKEIISKAKTVFENLPFFMKPGILSYDKMGVSFDNGCKLIGQSTSSRSGIGFTIHMLFLDEFAHIPRNIIEPFYENVMPTISSSNISRVIITSTVNGYNLFYTIWSNSPDNGFNPIEVNWWQVPGRDEAWKQQEIKRLGSEDAFDRQHGNKFMTSSKLLLDSTTIERFQRNIQFFKPTEENFEIFEFSSISKPEKYLKWHPDFDVEELSDPNSYFVLGVDVAEGIEQDYSVVNIFKINEMQPEEFDYIVSPGALPDFFKLDQVGVFSSNDLIPKYFAEALYIIGFELMDSERVKVMLEYNKYGELVLNYLESVLPQLNKFEHEAIVETKHSSKETNLKPGVLMKTDNKAIFCQNFKDITEQRRINIYDYDTIEEFKYFGKNEKGSYEAQQGHDDKAMSSIVVGEFFRVFDFIDFVEEYADGLPDEWHRKVDEKLELSAPEGEGGTDFDIYDIV